MKISNIKISKFRNIVSADINFGDINILTGRNSSGKTNFLLGIASSLSVESDQSDKYNDNVVTVGKGLNQTVFETTLSQLQGNVCHVRDEYVYVCLNPKEYVLKKTLDKDCCVKKIELKFSGEVLDPSEKKLTWIEYTKDPSKFNDYLKSYTNELVYKKDFEFIDEDGVHKTVKTSGTDSDFENEHMSQIKSSRNAIMPIIGFDKYEYSSSRIQNYVTKLVSREVTDEVTERLSQKEGRYSKSHFTKAEFVHLLADIISEEKSSDTLMKEVSLYTNNIIKNLSIGSQYGKGEITVESPNGAKNISSVSSGTAVLIYFIVLKNWLNLSYSQQRFTAPSVFLFDEIDSAIHPTLLGNLIEVLRGVSKRSQIFVTTHSGTFLDFFDRKEIYLLKDSLYGSKDRDISNRCNIFSYESIISKLPAEVLEGIESQTNSELFISGTIESIFNG
jgi:predicted ATP-dependent endonuclease of OLD family